MEDKRKFNPLVSKAKNDMKPGFLGGKGGGEKPSGLKTSPENVAAAEDLSSAEQAAADADLNGDESGLYNARKNENSAGGGLYRAGVESGAGRGGTKRGTKGRFKGRFKKGGPITAIILLTFLLGGIALSSLASMPFAIIENLRESFNSMHISAYNRSARFLRYQMATGERKSPIKNTVFGEKFSLSKKQIAKYEEQGLKYNDSYDGPDGKKIRVFEYETDGGQKRVVTADKNAAEKLRAQGVSAISFDAALNDNTFAGKFSIASQSWRGQFANWFGTKTGDFLSSHNLTRSLFKDWEKTKAEAEADPTKTALDAAKETIKNRIKEKIDVGISRVTSDGRDEDGKEQYKSGEAEGTSKYKTANEKLNSLKSKVSGGANVPCAIADFIGAVSLTAAASEALQIITIASAYMETVDKTKAGYGDEAPINELSESLVQKNRADLVQIVADEAGTSVTDSDSGESMTVNAKTEESKGEAKSAMQSAGMAALFGSGLTNPNDASVQSFNLTGSLNKILGGIGVSMSSFTACTIAKAVAAVASVGFTVAQCFFPPIVGCLGGPLKKALASVAFSAAVSLGIQGIITIIGPWFEKILTRDIVSTLAGEDLGNVLMSGGNMYQGYIHKTNGGSLGSTSKYEEFAIERQQVIAEEAKEDRINLSPFDITSKNTFMGTIMTQLMSFNTASSLTSMFTTGSSVMSSSLVAMTPTVAATSTQIAETLPNESEYEQTCPYLASIGAIGDSFCNPYMVTDFDTMDADPADVINNIKDNFEDVENSGDNVKIKSGSSLAKYIEYCGERTSAFGVADQTIIQDFKASTGSSIADAVIGATVVGDILDLTDSEKIFSNLGYVSGEACVATSDNDDYDSILSDAGVGREFPKWSEAKWYQRFIEDQSLAESMGIIDKSAVTAYLEEYYEENPLDDSYEGYLARWSGLSKETVSDTLDILAYYEYINEYDPSERYAFGTDAVEAEDEKALFDDEMVLAGDMPLLERVVYADVRNRSFVV